MNWCDVINDQNTTTTTTAAAAAAVWEMGTRMRINRMTADGCGKYQTVLKSELYCSSFASAPIVCPAVSRTSHPRANGQLLFTQSRLASCACFDHLLLQQLARLSYRPQ